MTVKERLVKDRFLRFNETYAQAFDRGDLQLPPAGRAAALVCMDARLHPERFLRLEIGDIHVIRNAGGRASDDAIRSLIISSRLLGTSEFMVIHHTDCGMLTFTNEDIRSRIKLETGGSAEDIDFLPFDDLDESVRDDVRRIRSSSQIDPAIPVSGLAYDVRTGRLREVDVDA